MGASASQLVENCILYSAATVADGLAGAAHVDQHLRDLGGGIAEVQEGEVAEEDLHGAVELGIQLGHKDDGNVPQHGQNIGHQEDHKERKSQTWPIRNTQKDEVLRGVPQKALVVTSHAEAFSGTCDELRKLG